MNTVPIGQIEDVHLFLHRLKRNFNSASLRTSQNSLMKTLNRIFRWFIELNLAQPFTPFAGLKKRRRLFISHGLQQPWTYSLRLFLIPPLLHIDLRISISPLRDSFLQPPPNFSSFKSFAHLDRPNGQRSEHQLSTSITELINPLEYLPPGEYGSLVCHVFAVPAGLPMLSHV
jgi:hypothetical protein